MSKWSVAIEKELDWRKTELAALKLKLFDERPISASDPQTPVFKALLRATWTMLYAHYEGYCLSLFSMYLDELERMNVPRTECRESIVIYSLRHHLPKLRNKPEKEFFAFLRSGGAAMFGVPIDFPRDKKLKQDFDLKGRANLWPKLLHECCEQFCVNCAAVNRMDTRLGLLVGRRNDIAHGKDTPVKDYDEYAEYEAHVLDLMEKLGSAIDSALSGCFYLDTDAKRRNTERLAYRIAGERGGDPESNWFEAERRLANGERP